MPDIDDHVSAKPSKCGTAVADFTNQMSCTLLRAPFFVYRNVDFDVWKVSELFASDRQVVWLLHSWKKLSNITWVSMHTILRLSIPKLAPCSLV